MKYLTTLAQIVKNAHIKNPSKKNRPPYQVHFLTDQLLQNQKIKCFFATFCNLQCYSHLKWPNFTIKRVGKKLKNTNLNKTRVDPQGS